MRCNIEHHVQNNREQPRLAECKKPISLLSSNNLSTFSENSTASCEVSISAQMDDEHGNENVQSINVKDYIKANNTRNPINKPLKRKYRARGSRGGASMRAMKQKAVREKVEVSDARQPRGSKHDDQSLLLQKRDKDISEYSMHKQQDSCCIDSVNSSEENKAELYKNPSKALYGDSTFKIGGISKKSFKIQNPSKALYGDSTFKVGGISKKSFKIQNRSNALYGDSTVKVGGIYNKSFGMITGDKHPTYKKQEISKISRVQSKTSQYHNARKYEQPLSRFQNKQSMKHTNVDATKKYREDSEDFPFQHSYLTECDRIQHGNKMKMVSTRNKDDSNSMLPPLPKAYFENEIMSNGIVSEASFENLMFNCYDDGSLESNDDLHGYQQTLFKEHHAAISSAKISGKHNVPGGGNGSILNHTNVNSTFYPHEMAPTEDNAYISSGNEIPILPNDNANEEMNKTGFCQSSPLDFLSLSELTLNGSYSHDERNDTEESSMKYSIHAGKSIPEYSSYPINTWDVADKAVPHQTMPLAPEFDSFLNSQSSRGTIHQPHIHNQVDHSSHPIHPATQVQDVKQYTYHNIHSGRSITSNDKIIEKQRSSSTMSDVCFDVLPPMPPHKSCSVSSRNAIKCVGELMLQQTFQLTTEHCHDSHLDNTTPKKSNLHILPRYSEQLISHATCHSSDSLHLFRPKQQHGDNSQNHGNYSSYFGSTQCDPERIRKQREMPERSLFDVAPKAFLMGEDKRNTRVFPIEHTIQR